MIKQEFLDYLGKNHQNLSLFFFDILHVKKYLFHTSKPLEVMGASGILSDFSENGIRSVLKKYTPNTNGVNVDDWVISSDGGSGLFLSPCENPEELRTELYKSFDQVTITGELAISYLETSVDELVNHFNEICNKLFHLNKLESICRSEKRLISIPPFLHKCDSCGIYPSCRTDDDEKLCLACYKKREFHRSQPNAELKAVKSFQDLVIHENGSTNSKKQMAVFYADGNNFATLFQNKLKQGVKEYSEFSTSLNRHIQDSVEKSCEDHGVPRINISFGGDDIFVALPASKSIVFTDTLKKYLGKHTNHEIANISYSFSLIFTKCNYPIRFLMDYAEVLLKNAKKVCYQNQSLQQVRNLPVFSVDFMTIKDASPLSHDIEHLRQTHMNTSGTTYLTKKPYQYVDFLKLLEKVKILKDAMKESKSQINIIADSLVNRIPNEAELTIDYFYAKNYNPHHKKPLDLLITESNKSLYHSLVQSCSQKPNQYETFFFDALELVDFWR